MGDDPSSKSGVDNNGVDFFSNGIAATEGANNEIAQVPNDEDNGIMNLDDAPNLLQGSSGCTPDIDRLPGKLRARRGEVCSPDRLQPNNDNGESDGGQSTTTTPTTMPPKSQEEIQPPGPPGQQNNDDDGSRPPPERKIILPSPNDPLPGIFVPDQSKPGMDPDLCYQRGYYIPVCAKESDQYPAPGSLSTYILDPCNPFFPLAACLPTERAYCCLLTTVAYKENREQLLAPFENLWSLGFQEIREAMMYHENPFKLVGVTCIPMPDQPKIKIPDHTF